ncbi:hypothetical protein Taro_051289 [Colocasia esculenta]|uniref:ABC1 atypical kinase-like domain-containing protein n=1 Tax=Colocasia esculenta TaxID=4460 RepID=A0A843XFL0_COLES|nr:hypothetical protein [Colocasia esculenta]
MTRTVEAPASVILAAPLDTWRFSAAPSGESSYHLACPSARPPPQSPASPTPRRPSKGTGGKQVPNGDEGSGNLHSYRAIPPPASVAYVEEFSPSEEDWQKPNEQIVCIGPVFASGGVFHAHSSVLDRKMSIKLGDGEDGINDLPKLVEEIVQTSISTGPRGAFRLAQGIQAVTGVGGEWLADVSQAVTSSNVLPNQIRLGLISPLYLRKLFERMGATYIKLGQFIASAPTLFPAEYVQEFQNCFDRAPAVPFNEIEAVLLEDLGRPLDSVYEYIDPVPIASASIAQVHGARLKGSKEEVVIKVLKPGIEDVLVADLNFIYIVARILEFLNPELRRTPLIPKGSRRAQAPLACALAALAAPWGAFFLLRKARCFKAAKEAPWRRLGVRLDNYV